MIWVDSQGALDEAMDHIGSRPVIGVDTEADSLHSYFDKVCLIQISTEERDYVIDPLSGIDLRRFGELLANADVTKILHGGDYDLRILNRDFGFTVANLIDTSVCAQLLGYEAFGLAALLERHFGVKVNKAHQRADWALRPLPADMLEYAALDTHYLIDLAAKIREELVALGRWEWAAEEFSRMESIRFRESEETEPWRKLKNISNLDRRSLAILRDLYAWRDALAREADRPTFKIIGNEAIVEIAREKPVASEDLAKIKAVPRYHADRYGRQFLRIVRAALDLPEADLPQKTEPQRWVRDREVENRVEKLKKIRDRVARELKIDPAILAPRHVLTAVAMTSDLEQVPAMREWQKRLIGTELLAVVQKGAETNRKLF